MSNAEKTSLGSVEVSLTPVERFREFLDSKGKRFTAQRGKLVEHIFSRHEHFEAEQLVEELSYGEANNRTSRATIYRTLGDLVDAGLLRKMDLPEKTVYEHDYGYPQHDHLYCTVCEELFEFQSDELKELRNKVAKDHQFKVTGHRLIVTGVCAECRRSKRKRNRSLDRV